MGRSCWWPDTLRYGGCGRLQSLQPLVYHSAAAAQPSSRPPAAPSGRQLPPLKQPMLHRAELCCSSTTAQQPSATTQCLQALPCVLSSRRYQQHHAPVSSIRRHRCLNLQEPLAPSAATTGATAFLAHIADATLASSTTASKML